MTDTSLAKELELRDEKILALEMLVVDQSCSLLVLQGLLLQAMRPDWVDYERLDQDIDRLGLTLSGRFESVTGLVERSKRMARSLMAPKGKK